VTLFGLVMGAAFIIWTIFTVIILSLVTEVFIFMRSSLFVVIVVVYVLILAIYPLGKRIFREERY